MPKHALRLLFLISFNNGLDHITPVIHRCAASGDVQADVYIEDGISAADYRIGILRALDGVEVVHAGADATALRARERAVGMLRRIGRGLPVGKLEGIYNRHLHSRPGLTIPARYLRRTYDALAFGWTRASRPQTAELVAQVGAPAVVLPHGHQSYTNQVTTHSGFERMLRGMGHNAGGVMRSSVRERLDPRWDRYQHFLYPSTLTAQQEGHHPDDPGVQILGSPRYNREWIDLLSEVVGTPTEDAGDALRVLMLPRRADFYVHRRACRDTVRLIAALDGCELVIQEHPRAPFFDDSAFEELDSVRIVRDPTASARLTRWADVVVSLGTSLEFEMLMLGKPALALEYCHANRSMLSEYFPAYSMQTIEHLGETLQQMVLGVDPHLPDADHMDAFIDAEIAPAGEPVLDRWSQALCRITSD
jgi:hypothetical protein